MTDPYVQAIRERIDRRDELATEIERACTGEMRYDDDDWMRVANAVMPIMDRAIADVLDAEADSIEATDTQKGTASRELSLGKRFAIDFLRDEARAFRGRPEFER